MRTGDDDDGAFLRHNIQKWPPIYDVQKSYDILTPSPFLSYVLSGVDFGGRNCVRRVRRREGIKNTVFTHFLPQKFTILSTNCPQIWGILRGRHIWMAPKGFRVWCVDAVEWMESGTTFEREITSLFRQKRRGQLQTHPSLLLPPGRIHIRDDATPHEYILSEDSAERCFLWWNPLIRLCCRIPKINRNIILGVPRITLRMFCYPPKNAACRNMERGFH